MLELVVEILQFRDGPIVHSKPGVASDLATAHTYAQALLYDVNTTELATAYRIRDVTTWQIVATIDDAAPADGQ